MMMMPVPESDTDLNTHPAPYIFLAALLLNIDDDVSWMAAAPDSLDEGHKSGSDDPVVVHSAAPRTNVA